MRTSLFIFFVLISFSVAFTSAQLVIDTTMTHQDLVENVLVGEGVEVSNITSNGDFHSYIGYFSSENSNVGLKEGIIMSNAVVTEAPGPNNRRNREGIEIQKLSYLIDSDLDSLTGLEVISWDISAIEFDFVPKEDSLVFRYVFASEEYEDFVGQLYNDAFAFFISGPGFNGPFSRGAENIALVPGTSDFVGINEINQNKNSEFYIYNGSGSEAPYDQDPYYIQFNGLTKVLSASAKVQCGETYHIKLVIGDGSERARGSQADTRLNSAVFLEASSFSSSELTVEAEYTPNEFFNKGSRAFEDCENVNLKFSRKGSLDRPMSVLVETSGEAVNGQDYTITDQLFFPVGVREIETEVTILTDNIAEGEEKVNLKFTYESFSCEISEEINYNFIIAEIPQISTSISQQGNLCDDTISLSVTLPEIGQPIWSYQWNTGATTSKIKVNNSVGDTYSVSITDICNINSVTDQVEITSAAAFDVALALENDSIQLESCGHFDLLLEKHQEDLSVVYLEIDNQYKSDFVNFPDSILFPDNSFEARYSLQILPDQVSEPNEKITVLAYKDSCKKFLIGSVDLYIRDHVDIEGRINGPSLWSCESDSVELTADIQMDYDHEGLSQVWSNGEASSSIFVQRSDGNEFTISVVDECGNTLWTESHSIEDPGGYAFETDVSNEDVNGAIYEGCGEIEIKLSKDGSHEGQFNIQYILENLESRTDLPDQITIRTEETEKLISLSNFKVEDKSRQGQLQITISNDDPCIQDEIFEFTVSPRPDYQVTIERSNGFNCGDGYELSAEVAPNAFDNFIQAAWEDGSTNLFRKINPSSQTTVSYAIADQCVGTTVTHEMVLSGTDTDAVKSNFAFQRVGVAYAFINQSVNGSEFSWIINNDGNILTSQDQDPTFTLEFGKDYEVSLTATNLVSSCEDESMQTIEVPLEVTKIVIPNAFTPNSDGLNDEFQIISGPLVNYEMIVLNRWGEIVFVSQDQNLGWDGQSDGEDVPIGAYYYKISADKVDELGDLKPVIKSGSIRVIR